MVTQKVGHFSGIFFLIVRRKKDMGPGPSNQSRKMHFLFHMIQKDICSEYLKENLDWKKKLIARQNGIFTRHKV